MHKKTSAPLAPWPQHHYLSKPGGGGVSHTRTGPGHTPHDLAKTLQPLLLQSDVATSKTVPLKAGVVHGSAMKEVHWHCAHL